MTTRVTGWATSGTVSRTKFRTSPAPCRIGECTGRATATALHAAATCSGRAVFGEVGCVVRVAQLV